MPSGHEEAANTECGLGLACQSGTDNNNVQPTFRRDTVMFKPAELLMIKKNAEEKLQNLEFTPATKQKSELLACANDTATTDDAAAGSQVMNARFALVSPKR